MDAPETVQNVLLSSAAHAAELMFEVERNNAGLGEPIVDPGPGDGPAARSRLRSFVLVNLL